MTKRVVAFTGLSGVGKTALIRTLGASVPLKHLQASSLIKEGRQASGETQSCRINCGLSISMRTSGFSLGASELKADTTTGLIILDGHTVIERDGGLTRIDPRVFGAIGIDSMIFLADEPEALAKRRRDDTTRNRPMVTVDNLRLAQEEAKDHAAVICRALSIPLQIFRPDQSALIAEALRR